MIKIKRILAQGLYKLVGIQICCIGISNPPEAERASYKIQNLSTNRQVGETK
ncbi:MAG: hypothetical protein WC614_06515 [bacterium]